jgi:hypothetical protein
MTEPTEYVVWDASVTFRADKGGDAWGPMLVTMRWEKAPQEVADLLVQLWKIYHAEVLAKAQQTGITLEMT